MTTPTPIRAEDPMKRIYRPGAQPGGKFGLCIYGRGGVGKTTLLGTMPGKGLVIDVPQIEGGTFVLEDHQDRIEIVPIGAWNEIEPVRRFLAEGKHDYKWVAIDSITAFQELAKRKTIRERNLDQDPAMISLQEYGKIGRLVGELAYQFRTLPVHTIWVAQERNTRAQEEGGADRTGPDLTPAGLSMLVPSLMMVGRLSIEPGEHGWERQLRVGPHDRFYAKMRAKQRAGEKPFPAIVRNPSLGQMLAYALGANVPRPEEVEDTGVVLG